MITNNMIWLCFKYHKNLQSKLLKRTMHDKTILSTVTNGIQKITLNRPSKKNAISYKMYTNLTKIITDSAKNESIFALVITGQGEFYSSGNDMKSFIPGTSNEGAPDVQSALNSVKELTKAFILYPKLLIAVVNGPAIGIAATTLGLCDIIYASEKAYFQTPFSKIGFSAEGCSTYTFPRILGSSKTGELLYLNHKMTAEEAKNYGFVSKVFKDKDINRIWSDISEITQFSLESIMETKRLIRRWDKNTLLQVNEEEIKVLSNIVTSESFIERMASLVSHSSKM